MVVELDTIHHRPLRSGWLLAIHRVIEKPATVEVCPFCVAIQMLPLCHSSWNKRSQAELSARQTTARNQLVGVGRAGGGTHRPHRIAHDGAGCIRMAVRW
eukprot:COSAG02_NODE_914_length_15990_cov_9.617897_6_plen_100_part_00